MFLLMRYKEPIKTTSCSINHTKTETTTFFKAQIAKLNQYKEIIDMLQNHFLATKKSTSVVNSKCNPGTIFTVTASKK